MARLLLFYRLVLVLDPPFFLVKKSWLVDAAVRFSFYCIGLTYGDDGDDLRSMQLCYDRRLNNAFYLSF